jgi:hypothetical protein
VENICGVGYFMAFDEAIDEAINMESTEEVACKISQLNRDKYG